MTPTPAPRPERPSSDRPASAPGSDAPLAPIGARRLEALREAIRRGTYPTESDVVGGLVRMFDEPRESRATEEVASARTAGEDE